MPLAPLRRALLLSLLALALLAAVPAAAAATIYCAPSPCAEGTPEATIADAVTAADTNAGPDTVSIGAGTHNVGTGLFVNQPDTEVHGAGIDQTILTADPFPASDPGTGRNVIAGYMSRLADLTLRIPSAVTAGNSSSQGADVYNGLVERVRIDAEGSSFGTGDNDGAAIGMLIRAGTVNDLRIQFAANIDASGLRIGGASDLQDVTINSPQPLYSDPMAAPNPVTVEARRFMIKSRDPLRVADGFFRLSDSVIDVSSAPPGNKDDFSTGAQVFDGRPPTPAGLSLDRVTFVGNGKAKSTVLSVAGQGAPQATFIHARHIVASGFRRTLAYQNFGSNPTADIAFSVVPMGAGTIVDTGDTPATLGGNQRAGNRGGDPMLLGDLSLPFGSPAVDIGGSDLITAGPTDLAGNPRPADGDGDGDVANDAGAFERTYTPDGATLKIKGKKVKLNRHGRGKISLKCPAANKQPGPCTAKLKLKTVRKVKFDGARKRLPLAESKQLKIPAGKTKKAKIEISGAKLRLVRSATAARKVRATVDVSDGYGEQGTVRKKLKLKPAA